MPPPQRVPGGVQISTGAAAAAALDMDMPRMDQLQLDKPVRLDQLAPLPPPEPMPLPSPEHMAELSSMARLPLFQNQVIVKCEAARLQPLLAKLGLIQAWL